MHLRCKRQARITFDPLISDYASERKWAKSSLGGLARRIRLHGNLGSQDLNPGSPKQRDFRSSPWRARSTDTRIVCAKIRGTQRACCVARAQGPAIHHGDSIRWRTIRGRRAMRDQYRILSYNTGFGCAIQDRAHPLKLCARCPKTYPHPRLQDPPR